MNLTEIKRKYSKDGYCIVNFFSTREIEEIKKAVVKRIKELSNKSDYFKKIDYKKIQNYHLLNIPDNEHKKMLKTSTRYVILNRSLLKTISKNIYANSIVSSNWGHNNFDIRWVGSLKKGQKKKKAIGFRISRPEKINRKDAIGIHCDLHVGGKIYNDKDVLISAWIPLTGFSKKHTLKIAPKSHLKDHPISNFVKRKTVSNIFKKKYYNSFKFLRPNLKKGQAIIFIQIYFTATVLILVKKRDLVWK